MPLEAAQIEQYGNVIEVMLTELGDEGAAVDKAQWESYYDLLSA